MEHQWKVINPFKHLAAEHVTCTQCGMEALRKTNRDPLGQKLWRLADLSNLSVNGEELRKLQPPETCEEEFVRRIMDD